MSTTIIFDPNACNEGGGGGGGEQGPPGPPGLDGSTNVFAIETGEQYTVEKNQELINSGLFHLDGELVLEGKWSLLSDTGIATGGFGQLPGNDHSHTELKVLAAFGMAYESDVYRQVIDHNLNQFPILKFLDQT